MKSIANNKNIISAAGFESFLCSTADFFNSIIHSAYSLIGIGIFCYIGSSDAQTTVSDYIGLKTTCAGSIESMYNNSFIVYVKNNGSNVYPTTTDLNLVDNNQLKLSIVLELYLYLLGKDSK